MALIKADRVKESSTSTGASTFALAGAFTGFRSFSSVCSVGDTFYYVIDSDLGSEWETGLGTYSAANTLTRTTVHSSSNGGSIVTFSAGTKNVYISLTGNQLGTLATLTGSEVLTNKTINASNNTITNVSLTTGVTGTLPLANGGTGSTTAQLAINALAGAVTSGSYLRGNGTNVVMATIAAGDVPTLNQNTTGTASGSVSGTASYLAKFTGTNVVGNSLISDNGTNILVGTQNPTYLGRFNITSSVQASTTTGIVLQNFSSLGLIGLDLFNDGNKEAFIGIGGSGYAAPYGDNVVCMAYGSVNLIFGTVGAERMRINSQGNVGIGTTSPADRLHVYKSGDASAKIEGTTSAVVNFTKNAVYCGYVGVGSAGSNDIYIYNLASGAVRINAQAVYVTATNLVGINETAPGAQLQVTTAAAATKGLIVRGASAQSANLLELQNSSGTVLASVDPSGIAVFGAQTGAQNGYTIRAWSTPANALNGQILTSLTGASGGNERYRMSIGNTSSYGFLQTYENAIGYTMSLALQPSGGSVGVGTTSPAVKLEAVGAVRSSGYTGGGDGTYLELTGDLPGYPASRYPTLRSDGSIYFAVSGRYSAYLNSVDNSLNIANTATQWRISLHPSGTSYFAGGALAVGSTTAPSGQLYVTPQAAATKGLVVRGASAQSANLQEWQDSAGSVLAYVSSNASVIGTPSNCFIGANDNSGGQIVLYGAAGGYGIGLKTTSLGAEVIRFNSGQLLITIGQGGNNAGLLVNGNLGASGSVASFVNVGNVASKGIVVKGVASQTGNLQEWQNNAGSALAYVTSAGDIVGAGGAISTGAGNGTDGYGESGPVVLVNKWLAYNTGSIYFNIRKLYGTRAFPATYANGDYVEIAKIYRQGFHPITLTIHAAHGAVNGAASKVYVITPDYNFGNWTAAPLSGGKVGDFDFDVELVAPDPYTLAIRVRRHSSSTPTYANIIFTIESHNYNRGGMVELSGTGNSASALPYRSDYQRIGPTVSAPSPVGGSGAGTDLAIYGGSAIGTGAGGNILLQAGAFATSGSNGKVIVRGLASNTANLQEWQNNAGAVLSAVNSAGSFTNTGGYSYSEEFGNAATVTNQYATAIGYGATAGQLSTAVGSFAVTSGATSTAIGADANADSGSTAVGRQATASGGSATAIGVNANAVGNNSIAIGRLAASNGGIAIGYNFTGAGLGYTSFCASLNGYSTTGAIAVYAGDGANNGNFSRQHSMLGTWATATYASRLGRVQLRVNDYTTDREAIRYESDGASALTSIGGSAVIASTTLAVQPAVSGNKGIVVKGASGQSANLLELQNSSGQIGLSVSVNQFGEATFVNGPRYISTAPEFSAGLWLQYQDSTIDRTNVRMHVSASIGFAAGSASNTSLDTYVSRGDAGVLRVNAASGAGGSIAITSNTPAAFTTDQNNLALTASGFQRLSGTAARNITGIAPPSGSHVDGRMIRIYNVGSFNLTLKHNSTSSTAANRLWNVQAIDIIVGANDYAELIYDGTNNGSGAAGWRAA